MEAITKYLSIGLGVLCALLIIYCLLLRNDRDNALNKIDSLNGQINTAITANLNLQNTIKVLKVEDNKKIAYIQRLESKKQENERKYQNQLEGFRHVKNSNETINTWANTKLPDGLCQ